MMHTIIWGVIALEVDPVEKLSPGWQLFAGIGGTVLVALITGIFAVRSNRAQKGSRENRIIDQLQENLDRTERLRKEDREAASTRSDKQDARMAKIETRLYVVEKVSRIRLEYIYELRRHIANGEPPPAPDWPPGIHD